MSFRPSKSSHRLQRQAAILVLFLAVSVAANGCSALPLPRNATPSTEPTAAQATVTPTPEPTLPETEVNFWVDAPAETPAGDTVYLSVLDEVTGLALNAENYPMELVESAEGAPIRYHLSLAVPNQSVVQYRYERQSDGARVVELTSDGRAVRYRLYHADGPGGVEDVISRWTDTGYNLPSGRIMGEAWDAVTGLPVPNLLVTAGGQQTISASDGSFLFEGLPPGVHNLVALAMDGWYATFQQGAQVAAESTTPAELLMTPVPAVQVRFNVSLPADTPPLVPVRMAGNLAQLGNTFATLTGGVNGVTSAMPVLQVTADGTYSTTLTLPAGATIRYKYTLGDGFWNAEHTSSGSFRVRQVILPQEDGVVQDVVDTWSASQQGPLVLDVQVPEQTPPEDQVKIQFNPVSGWTEPIPMWRLGPYRWAYILYSPLNLPGALAYRYCRNDQCEVTGPDGQTQAVPERQVEVGEGIQNIKDQVEAWPGLPEAIQPVLPTVEVIKRFSGFWTGVELQPAYHPAWKSRLPLTMDEVAGMGANTLVLSPTWTFTRNSPPVFEMVPGQDPLPTDVEAMAQGALARNLKVAIFPTPHFPTTADAWWRPATRDFSWWLVWFAHYRTFVLHNADLAASSGAQALILGGEWVRPALPGGVLEDGAPSGVPADAETRWRELIQEVRARYSGEILWAMPYWLINFPPPFLDALDQVYLLWDNPTSLPADTNLESYAVKYFDETAQYIQIAVQKPFILAVNFPTGAAPQDQLDAYQTLLSVVNQRSWIGGFVSRGFYPPMPLLDNSPSVHGKPSESLLRFWYPLWTGSPQ